MREQINILKYGFLLFLIVVGIVSIFNQEANFINAINSLSLPIFMFTISILFVKANKYARDVVWSKIMSQEKVVDEQKAKVIEKGEAIKKTDNNKIALYEQFKELHQNSLISMEEMGFLFKWFNTIDVFTKVFNLLSLVCFAWCLLSLTGIIAIHVNFAWVNIFSLALVFFDFFVFDDLLKRFFKRKFEKLHEQAEKEITQKAGQKEESDI